MNQKVGWGYKDSSALHENIPHQVLISSVTAEVCFAKDYNNLGAMFAEGMYCAGGDGAGPCSGDSGEWKFIFSLSKNFFADARVLSDSLIFKARILWLSIQFYIYVSGGGFFVNYYGLWTLRGVVSSGIPKAEGGCEVDRYTLFTNALDYTSWISDVVRKNATRISIS